MFCFEVEKFNSLNPRVQFPGESSVEFRMDTGEVVHLCRKALNILLPSATPTYARLHYSAMAAIRTKYCSVMNLGNYYRAAVANSSIGTMNYVQRGEAVTSDPLVHV
jgi:hypothetical protein